MVRIVSVNSKQWPLFLCFRPYCFVYACMMGSSLIKSSSELPLLLVLGFVVNLALFLRLDIVPSSFSLTY
uniref:Uncharacterized protein n=1 Tax=Solanum lycopersicum TaxID=4081 RepID=A0A3Q7FL30_SOLLC